MISFLKNKNFKKTLSFIVLCCLVNINAEDEEDMIVTLDDTINSSKENLDSSNNKEIKKEVSPSSINKQKKNSDNYITISSVSIKDCLSSQSLRAVAFLWTEKDATGIIRPGNGIVKKPQSGATYQLFSELKAKSTGNSYSYKVEDTIDILKSLRFIYFNNKPANIIKRVGRAKVKEVKGKELKAILFEVWDVIGGGEMISSSVPVYGYTVDTLLTPELPISAKILTKIEETICPYPMQMIILDKGKNNGIGLGDVFGIYHHDKNGISSLSAVGSVVYIDDATTTLRIVLVHDLTISDGDEAIIIRRPQLTILE